MTPECLKVRGHVADLYIHSFFHTFVHLSISRGSKKNKSLNSNSKYNIAKYGLKTNFKSKYMHSSHTRVIADDAVHLCQEPKLA